MQSIRLSPLVILLAICSLPAAAADLVVAIDLPGGSAKVQVIDQQARRVRIEPTPHTGRGWNCWWYFRLTGITAGETIELDVGPAPWATPQQAHFSIDGGKTWRQTSPGKRDGVRIAYRQAIDAAEALFAWGPPFTTDDAATLVKQIATKLDGKDGAKAEAFELCKSREGRSTPALKITPPAMEGVKPRGIFVCARQHAWESGGSWVGRGFIEFIVSDDPAAVALRKNTIVYFVPLMDVDNVSIGAGGKNQDPHDHNRDWTDKPVFPAVAAAQKIIRDLDAAGGFDAFIDLHNPAAGDLKPFFFVSEGAELRDKGKENLAKFVATATKHIAGPMALNTKTRASGASYDKNWKAISKNWVNANTKDGTVAVTLETSWNTPHSNIEGYTTVGRQLAAAVAEYLSGGRDQRP